MKFVRDNCFFSKRAILSQLDENDVKFIMCKKDGKNLRKKIPFSVFICESSQVYGPFVRVDIDINTVIFALLFNGSSPKDIFRYFFHSFV